MEQNSGILRHILKVQNTVKETYLNLYLLSLRFGN